MRVSVGGEEIPIDAIERWERKRAKHVGRFLQKQLGLTRADITKDDLGHDRDIAEVREELVEMKLGIAPETVRTMLRRRTGFSSLSTKFINQLSLKKRKFSVIDIRVPGCTAAEMEGLYFNLMLEPTERNRRRGLVACPDHYLLEPHPGNVQEVIETTGGSPMPSAFFIHYGVEEGLESKFDPSFTHQAAGVCRLEDGTPIGGVRHQMRDEDDGLLARLTVEFPRALLPYMIKQHQMHLACEFHRWFTDLSEDSVRARGGRHAD